jgi:hypothetical protein
MLKSGSKVLLETHELHNTGQLLLAQMGPLRVTLDKGPRSRVSSNRAIPLAKSHKLDAWPLDKCPKLISGKLRLNIHGTNLEGKSIVLDPKK